MTDDERKAAFAEALERSRLMLDDEACSDAVAAETAKPRVHRDYGFSNDWHAGMPKKEPEPAPVQRRKLTDAESLRWKNYIDGTINAAVDAALAEIRMSADASVVATGKALGAIRAQLRQEMADEIGSLRADLTIAKAHAGDNAKVIDLPAFVGKRDAR